MKILSIQQPWAWLIASGFKDIENRTWRTNFRGQFLIHAGKTFDMEGYNFVRERFLDVPIPGRDIGIGSYRKSDWHLGGIVGEAYLIDCVRDHISRWFHGPFGFVIQNAVPLTFQQCRGKLGFFEDPKILS